MNSIDSIVKTLSSEEIKINKELIEECRQRESLINKSKENLKKDFEKLNTASKNFMEKLQEFNEITGEFKETCDELVNIMPGLLLFILPDDKFYNA